MSDNSADISHSRTPSGQTPCIDQPQLEYGRIDPAHQIVVTGIGQSIHEVARGFAVFDFIGTSSCIAPCIRTPGLVHVAAMANE